MTKEEIEKQIADYKAAKKKYEQQQKELEAKREAEKRLYEDRVRKGYIKHKGEELGSIVSNTTSKNTKAESYIKENNVSIEDMEKYLNDNNFDYVIKGGKQDKGGGFGDSIEAEITGIYNALDKFLGGHVKLKDLPGLYNQNYYH